MKIRSDFVTNSSSSSYILKKQLEKSEFETIGTEIGKLVEGKNKAYGDSFFKCEEFLKLTYPDGVKVTQYGDMLTLVRIFDKMMRVATNNDPFGESPYTDITGYGILGVAKTKRKKTNEDKI